MLFLALGATGLLSLFVVLPTWRRFVRQIAG